MVESTHWMVLHRPVELAALTGELEVGLLIVGNAEKQVRLNDSLFLCGAREKIAHA
jgi:hypothetical protein